MESWTPWVVPGVQLMSFHLVLIRHYKIRVRAFGQLGVGPMPFLHTQSYLHSRSCLTTPLQSALKQSDCRIEKKIYLATSELSRVKQREQTHVCTSSATAACDDVGMKELR